MLPLQVRRQSRATIISEGVGSTFGFVSLLVREPRNFWLTAHLIIWDYLLYFILSWRQSGKKVQLVAPGIVLNLTKIVSKYHEIGVYLERMRDWRRRRK